MKKINLKEKLDEDTLDLSMSDLTSVPVKEISEITKARNLNLSFNNLIHLPEDFIKLQNIRVLDLSKNHLKALPKNFGQLVNLKHLDLFRNDLECLPLSFYQLKNLQWLDLKDNPLNLKLKSIAGDCLDEQQCKKCAVNVLKYAKQLASDEERKHQELLKKQREEEQKRLLAEEEERKKLRELKKQEKEEKKKRQLEEQQNKRAQQNENSKQCGDVQDDTDYINRSISRKTKKTGGRCVALLANLLLTLIFLALIIFILFNIYCERLIIKTDHLLKSKSPPQALVYINSLCSKYNEDENVKKAYAYFNKFFSSN